MKRSDFMKTGTSMSKIENTRKVKKISCDCSRCYHSEKLRSHIGDTIRHCKYYDLINPKKKSCARYYPVRASANAKSKNKKWSKKIKEAEKQLKEQKFHYKDKPVHGEPTDRQINAIKRFCHERHLTVSIIGMDRAEASKILAYFFNKTGKEEKPKCFSKYIN